MNKNKQIINKMFDDPYAFLIFFFKRKNVKWSNE